jgi:hypothetical protein
MHDPATGELRASIPARAAQLTGVKRFTTSSHRFWSRWARTSTRRAGGPGGCPRLRGTGMFRRPATDLGAAASRTPRTSRRRTLHRGSAKGKRAMAGAVPTDSGYEITLSLWLARAAGQRRLDWVKVPRGDDRRGSRPRRPAGAHRVRERRRRARPCRRRWPLFPAKRAYDPDPAPTRSPLVT